MRFGVRVRRDSDRSNQPSGFNGTFTFLGGVEPVLECGEQDRLRFERQSGHR